MSDITAIIPYLLFIFVWAPADTGAPVREVQQVTVVETADEGACRIVGQAVAAEAPNLSFLCQPRQ